MIDQTIQIGIDLGTTNSSISINQKGQINIVKIDREEYVPSVFGFDKAKNKVVGKKAYSELFQFAREAEFDNYTAEVKRLMGTNENIKFNRAGKSLSPEEISAEILIYLKEGALKQYPELASQGAVITTPAYFSILESEATKRAGNLAGFDYVVLLQEPIAAAMAYGFDKTGDDYWLVYDLGGGTFDVALISSKDGVLSVREHNGDNFLGGKDIDWLIVDKIITPKITSKFTLSKLNRSDKDDWRFYLLKYLAEEAKKDLSDNDSTVIEVNHIGNDDKGDEIYLAIDFSREELQKLVEPLINKTINLAKETIKNSGIESSLITKLVLVGGPTQMPYIKKKLERELSIEVDDSVDPLTVVAKGACIFGSSQKIPKKFMKSDKAKDKSEKTLELFYDPMTSEKEELVTGVIEDLKESDKEYFLQIQSESGFYTSPQIKVKSGKFFETIPLEEKKQNLFWVYLFDDKGSPLKVNPDSFSITQGMSVSGAPIAHSIGLAVAKRDFKENITFTEVFEKVFERNSILPLKKTETFYTVRNLKKGETDNVLPVKVYEGESEIPDRNTFICVLSITGKDIPHDLPEGTEIQITLNVDESREVSVDAFVPGIDLVRSIRASKYDEEINVSKLEEELLEQRQKYTNNEANISPDERIKIESEIESIGTSIKNASDLDEKRKASKELRDLKTELDKLEKEKEIPQLRNDFLKVSEDTKELIKEQEEKDKLEYQAQLDVLMEEGEKAYAANDKDMLVQVNEQIRGLGLRIIFSNPSVWVYQFEKITSGEYKFTNETDATYYIDKGKKAIQNNDIDELKRCTLNLINLLPKEQQEEISSNLSGIRR